MPSQIQTFKMLPWIGGTNTALDPSMIPPSQLVAAENVLFGTRGSRKKRNSINYNWDTATTNSDTIIGFFDFWYGSSVRTQRQIAVTDSKKIFSYTTGSQSANLFAGTAWANNVTKTSFLTFNNQCLIAVDGDLNPPKKWSGTGNVTDLGVNTTTGNIFFLSTTGNITSGSNQLTSVTTITGIAAGQQIAGTGIPVGTTVLSIASNTVTMSANASATTSSLAITFASNQITNLAATSGAIFGATITGTGIPANTTVNSIVGVNNFITMSKFATAGGTAVSVTFTATVPAASIFREHLGRVWCNDKTNLDRINYSTTANQDEWLGQGDSGALDIGTGDGDPEGITAIFPTFKGVLFVAKKTKLYRVDGDTPGTFQVTQVSNGIGCVSHNSVSPVDQDDMYFVSEKGVHSLVTTQQFGDFLSSFVSTDIQPTFSENFSRARLKYVNGGYLSDINSVAFTFTDTTLSGSANNSVWFYNIPLKSWYGWPNVPCQSMAVVSDGDRKRPYFGGVTGRIGRGFGTNNYDTSTSGANAVIPFKVKTGVIYVDEDENTVKAFKFFTLHYRPVGTHTVTVTIKIDNYPKQVLTFSETDSSALLGSTFILGVSELGSDVVMSPYTQTLDGYGRGIQITIEQNGTDEEIEIQGFSIGWEPAGGQQEVIGSQSSA